MNAILLALPLAAPPATLFPDTPDPRPVSRAEFDALAARLAALESRFSVPAPKVMPAPSAAQTYADKYATAAGGLPVTLHVGPGGDVPAGYKGYAEGVYTLGLTGDVVTITPVTTQPVFAPFGGAVRSLFGGQTVCGPTGCYRQ